MGRAGAGPAARIAAMVAIGAVVAAPARGDELYCTCPQIGRCSRPFETTAALFDWRTCETGCCQGPCDNTQLQPAGECNQTQVRPKGPYNATSWAHTGVVSFCTPLARWRWRSWWTCSAWNSSMGGQLLRAPPSDFWRHTD